MFYANDVIISVEEGGGPIQSYQYNLWQFYMDPALGFFPHAKATRDTVLDAIEGSENASV